MHFIRVLQVLTLACFAIVAQAEVPAEVRKAISDSFAAAMDGYKIESLVPSEIDGLYEVKLVNGPTLLSTPNGQYVISGAVFSLEGGELVNLTEKKMAEQAMAELDRLYENGDLIVYSPEKPAKHWVAVFTDTKCGYCRKFHNDMAQMNAMGIEVRYVAYPAFGGEESHRQMLSAWCSDNPQAAMDTLKSGGSIPTKTCDKAKGMEAQFALGRNLGFKGTPGMVLDNGTLVPGWRPPEELARMLGM